MEPQFTHDCTADTLVGIIAGVCDIYAQRGGSGYTLRYGNGGPEYTSFASWSLADALRVAAKLTEPEQPARSRIALQTHIRDK